MTTIQTQIPVIEITRIFYTGNEQILRIISVEDIKSIEVDHIDKSIDIVLNKTDEEGLHKVESYYDDVDKSFITMRFTNIVRVY